MDSPASIEELIGRPLPELALTASDGAPFPIRGRVGAGPLVLFFYIRNGTPG